MKRARLSLLLALGAACSPAAATNASSGGSSSVGIGGSTGAHAITGATGSSSGAPSSTGTSGTAASSSNTGSSGATSGGSASITSSSSASSSSGSGQSTSPSSSSSSSSSGGACTADGQFAGIGEAALCCSGIANAAGYCEAAATSSSSSGAAASTSSASSSTSTSAASSTGGTSGSTGSGSTAGSTGTTGLGTGTTTGGTCPVNMPNLDTGVTTTVAGSCSQTSDPCPPGFSCDVGAGKCILHGSSAPLQITMSWDLPEDLDLHVREPQAGQPYGYCEIWYGNVGNRPYPDGGLIPGLNESGCTPVGWLDRDSNPACNLDNVDVENVIYPTNQAPPSGTYEVYADYYQDCYFSADDVPEYQTVPYAIQVRRDNQIFVYCQSFVPTDADSGGAMGGVPITSFTLP